MLRLNSAHEITFCVCEKVSMQVHHHVHHTPEDQQDLKYLCHYINR